MRTRPIHLSSCLRFLLSSPTTSKLPTSTVSTNSIATLAFANNFNFGRSSILPTTRDQFTIRNCATSTATSTATSDTIMTDAPKISLDLSKLSASIVESETQRQNSFEIASKLKVALARARHASLQRHTHPPSGATTTTTTTTVSIGESEELSSLVTKAMQVERIRRPPSLSFAIQDHIRLQAYHHFLTLSQQRTQPSSNRTATESDSKIDSDGLTFLLPPSSNLFQFPTSTTSTNTNTNHDYDEDYLMGIMGLTQDLSRFAISSGTTRNAHAVTHARNVVRDVLDYLLGFDFRNGHLRRKYDGVKYALKTCETVLYELSVTGCRVDGGDDGGEDGTARKRFKKNAEEGTTTTNSASDDGGEGAEAGGIREELRSLRRRIEHRDDLRETLIKRCRDAQKKAKQAIYALHREDYRRADVLLEECEGIAQKDLIPIVEEEKSLRLGSSLGGVLEEYAEGMLFRAWILGTGKVGDAADGEGGTTLPRCMLLQPHHLTAKLPLTTEEYLGGLCDLSGEVGRYAVQRGTIRDSNGVRLCLDTNRAILHAFETLERLPAMGGIGKKIDPLRFSVEKLERMCYELSLVEATGRSIVVDSVKEMKGSGGDAD